MAFFDSFWTITGGIASVSVAAILVVRYLIKKARRRKKLRLFLTTQMSHLEADGYREVRDETMKVAAGLRRLDRIENVYYLNDIIASNEGFKDEDFDVDDYLSEIDKCDYFVAIILEQVYSSVYFEAGYALTQRKQSIYFVPKGKSVMPLVMRTISKIHPKIRVFEYSELSDIGKQIKQMINYL